MTIPKSLSHAVAAKLGHYVYLYVDPRSNKPLYVGKGTGARVLAHLKSKSTKNFPAVLKRLRAEGREPIIQILAHRLPSAQVALQVEAAVIDALGIENLKNRVHGWRSRQRGLALLNELVARYTGRRVKITHKVIMMRINRLFPVT